jgi:hypothetical protein
VQLKTCLAYRTNICLASIVKSNPSEVCTM